MARKVIGIDANGSQLKLVETTQSLRKVTILRVAETQNIESFLRNGTDLSSSLQVSFPQEKVTSRLVHFPFSADRKIEMATPFELESWVPNPADEFITDYQIVKKEKNASLALIAGVKKENIKTWVAEWEKKGFTPLNAVPEGYAFRSLAKLMDAAPETTLAFLDIAESRSLLSVTKGDRAIAARHFNTGLKDLGDKPLDEAFGKLAQNIDNTLRYLLSEEGIFPVKIFLCGDGALTPGIVEYFKENIGVDTSLWKLPGEKIEDFSPAHALALAIALERSHSIKGIDLRKGELGYQAETAVIGRKLVMPALLIAALVILLVIEILIQNRTIEVKAATLDAKIATLLKALIPTKEMPAAEAVGYMKAEIERSKKLEEALGKTDYLTPLQALTAISERIPPKMNLDIEEISLTDKILTITGIITEHSQMDNIKSQLEGFAPFKKFDIPQIRQMIGKQENRLKFSQKIFLTEEEEVK